MGLELGATGPLSLNPVPKQSSYALFVPDEWQAWSQRLQNGQERGFYSSWNFQCSSRALGFAHSSVTWRLRLHLGAESPRKGGREGRPLFKDV